MRRRGGAELGDHAAGGAAQDVTTVEARRPPLRATGWEFVPSSYDATTKTLSAEVTDLPTTLVVVDDSRPADPPGWDPDDPAALQFADGTWGVAYVYYPGSQTPPNVVYRHTLTNQEPPYWLDQVTV
jgi:hypothetical protein